MVEDGLQAALALMQLGGRLVPLARFALELARRCDQLGGALLDARLELGIEARERRLGVAPP